VSPANIVLVAYDKGIHLLEQGNKLQDRLGLLIRKGVQCFACETSQAGLQDRLVLIEGVKNIVNGKHYIDTLMEQGFTNSCA
jgi:intracellular sulfur oxidation DsrE/DsrF family protein